MLPPVVTAASPSGIEPMRSQSSSTRGPPLRRIAPATPAPRIRSLLAALTIASTAISVMSPWVKKILAGISSPRSPESQGLRCNYTLPAGKDESLAEPYLLERSPHEDPHHVTAILHRG